jgi:hypothetical protein
MDPCALTLCLIFSFVGPVLCFFGVRKCTAPRQDEDIDHRRQFYINPWASKYEPSKRSVHHITKPWNGTGTIYPMDSASQVNTRHTRREWCSGKLDILTPSFHGMRSGNSVRSLTSSKWEEACAAGFTPSEIEAYTPYYRCAITCGESGGPSTHPGTYTIYPEDSASQAPLRPGHSEYSGSAIYSTRY